VEVRFQEAGLASVCAARDAAVRDPMSLAHVAGRGEAAVCDLSTPVYRLLGLGFRV
jgi:hypothetical protein